MQPFRLLSLRPLALILFTGLAAPAYADIYKCTDTDGRVTYTNDRSLGRGCVRLQSDQPVSSIPSPARRPSAAAPATGSSAAFPRVSPSDQRNRDDARRQVLQSELTTEEGALAAAEKALAEQEAVRFGDERNYQKVLDRLQPFKDKVDLHKRNIEALRREISGLR
ncbi:DUF4124 domain-containing protein [Thauera sp.]|jgi:hypothetical protein|uniref:DUF4124 domain-containing protein n=1 Tax=Thauera sp. TaxID=1905334 RepID=UPI002A35DD4C|nr:DUF4124 domain-containing protein [Thauera sp.]MDX9885805.1 DUF4124 domain-containing protein [Thauera sp.]